MSSLTKEKKMNAQYLSHIDQWLQEALQLRSSVFQVSRVSSEVDSPRSWHQCVRMLSVFV